MTLFTIFPREMMKINTQLLFATIILKRLLNHGYFSYSQENRFRSYLLTTMT